MFKGLGKLVKKAAPIAISAFAPGIAPGMNPFLAGALTSGLGAVLTGQKPKDAILSGILGGVTSSAFAPAAGTTAAGTGQTLSGLPAGARGGGQYLRTGVATSTAPQAAATGFGGFTGKALGAEGKTMSGELLKSLNFAGEDEGNLLFKLLNTKMGEGLAAGLLAQALAGEEEKPQGEYERRPFGEGYGGGQIGGIQYMNQGGDTYFPRRNGGIDPSEGSGKKDDVPAMLMAGEFVMTRDAVKGMGDGNLRKGIGRMYDMMDNLERMA